MRQWKYRKPQGFISLSQIQCKITTAPTTPRLHTLPPLRSLCRDLVPMSLFMQFVSLTLNIHNSADLFLNQEILTGGSVKGTGSPTFFRKVAKDFKETSCSSIFFAFVFSYVAFTEATSPSNSEGKNKTQKISVVTCFSFHLFSLMLNHRLLCCSDICLRSTGMKLK